MTAVAMTVLATVTLHARALHVAHALGIAVDDARWQAPQLPDPPAPLAIAPGVWTLGSAGADGFAFDNELGLHRVPVDAFEIDARAVRWSDYLPLVEAGGATPPRHLRRAVQRGVAQHDNADRHAQFPFDISPRISSWRQLMYFSLHLHQRSGWAFNPSR